MQRLPVTDGMRAIAVLAVVLFHTYPQALPGGFIGVDIFFVISGYIAALGVPVVIQLPTPSATTFNPTTQPAARQSTSTRTPSHVPPSFATPENAGPRYATLRRGIAL